jgi:hypothetical protein
MLGVTGVTVSCGCYPCYPCYPRFNRSIKSLPLAKRSFAMQFYDVYFIGLMG